MKKLNQGWVEGSVKDFLSLSDADIEYIETRRALSRQLRIERIRKHLTQTDLAAALKTSQSRVAKMEKGDPMSPGTLKPASYGQFKTSH